MIFCNSIKLLANSFGYVFKVKFLQEEKNRRKEGRKGRKEGGKGEGGEGGERGRKGEKDNFLLIHQIVHNSPVYH
jgi:hypothetical protein